MAGVSVAMATNLKPGGRFLWFEPQEPSPWFDIWNIAYKCDTLEIKLLWGSVQMEQAFDELRSKLFSRGASLVGFADLADIPEQDRKGFTHGISIGVAIDPDIIRGIENGPTLEYYDEYTRLNKMLDNLADFAAGFLAGKGYEAHPQSTTIVAHDRDTLSTPLPHKTVATRAGLGWIGKCALLVTEQFGSAIRITSVLTNASLPAGAPVNESRCGNCTLCRDACPGNAVRGSNWSVDKNRDDLYDVHRCQETAIRLMSRLGVSYTLCGKCIYICPWTQRYLKAHGSGG